MRDQGLRVCKSRTVTHMAEAMSGAVYKSEGSSEQGDALRVRLLEATRSKSEMEQVNNMGRIAVSAGVLTFLDVNWTAGPMTVASNIILEAERFGEETMRTLSSLVGKNYLDTIEGAVFAVCNRMGGSRTLILQHTARDPETHLIDFVGWTRRMVDVATKAGISNIDSNRSPILVVDEIAQQAIDVEKNQKLRKELGLESIV